jgi:hypothetical protein
MSKTTLITCAAALMLLAWSPSVQAAGGSEAKPLVELHASDGRLDWEQLAESGNLELVVTSPDGRDTQSWTFKDNPSIDLEDVHRAFGEVYDGCYKWEVRGTLPLDSKTLSQLKDLRNAGQPMPRWYLAAIKDMQQAGSFWIVDGRFQFDTLQEDTPDRLVTGSAGVEELDQVGVAVPDALDFAQIISPDGVVYNSLCVGFDCPNSPSFGADTIRLQENNLRIHVDDTSTAGSFPNQDWRLEFNSNANGGAEYFRVIDATASRNIFTVEANAPSDSLVVDSGGRIGAGTANPVTEIHSANGDTPTLRLDQTTASGFAAQVWDVAGNETSFFIRDATNGSTLPFRIRPGAASNTLVIDADSDVGIGTLTADEALHVKRSSDANVLIENTTGTSGNRIMTQYRNNGPVTVQYINTAGDTWGLNALVGGFAWSVSGSGVNEMLLSPTGDLTIQGTLTELSDRNAKTNIKQVDSQMVLDRLLDLPIATWQRRGQDGITHLGPMAQDFRALFGLGVDDTSIATVDMAGVTMAAVQALNAKVEAKDAEIERLEARLAALEAALTALQAPAP